MNFCVQEIGQLRYEVLIMTKYLPILLACFWAALPVFGEEQSPIGTHAAIVHAVNRLSFGPGPLDIDEASKMGIQAYINQQLNPTEIPLPVSLDEKLKKLTTIGMTPGQLQEYTNFNKKVNERNHKAIRNVLQESMQARLLRAIESPRQLYEVMVDFWYNHFNVASTKGPGKIWVGAYENEAIRPHALGKFLDLLRATAQHPAMLFYLDNWQNKAYKNPKPGKKGKPQGINENYARELMELHTLGVDGGYTQDDVIALAKILTGWTYLRVPFKGIAPFTFIFNPKVHDHSDKQFLGQTIKGDGITEGETALQILARHPSTAKHISFKLAQYFVQDNPPPQLVSLLASEFTSSDGDIKTVLRALFNSSYFWDESTYYKKFKTPYRFIISAVRATGAQVNNYRPLMNHLFLLGMPIYGCQTPDGYKNIQSAWLSPDGVIKRITFTTGLARGRLPIAANPEEGKNKLPENITEVDLITLEDTLGNSFSDNTRNVIQNAPKKLRAELLLGSPEFMRH